MSAPERYYRRVEVEEITGLATSTIYKLMAEEKFPRPVRVTDTAVRWPASSIAAWQEQRASATAA